jgi:hypothetical protein
LTITAIIDRGYRKPSRQLRWLSAGHSRVRFTKRSISEDRHSVWHQANAFAINNLGSIAGVGYTDPFNGPFTAFIDSHGSFSRFQFPGSIYTQLQSINNFNDLAGAFVDPDGTASGMATVYGHPYQVYAGLFGNDDLDRICGYTYDFNAGRYRGLIGTPPLQRSR